ncbi:MAG: heavy-metal-associated domain-containing protein [Propionibacteriaceae bacterium]|jgi:copper chaperone CopZ|nr:heavy-metal-associated domain-containing protein [Propionibacteriaceae bacterium]
MIAEYTVSGLTCDHCVKAVKQEVSAIPGVNGVELSIAGDLKIDSSQAIDFDRVVEAVAEAGDYTVA